MDFALLFLKNENYFMELFCKTFFSLEVFAIFCYSDHHHGDTLIYKSILVPVCLGFALPSSSVVVWGENGMPGEGRYCYIMWGLR